MNKEQFAAKWHELKSKVKQKWGKLMDEDIAHINGKYEELSGRIQKRYGYSKEQADREITSWYYSYEKECRSCDSSSRQ